MRKNNGGSETGVLESQEEGVLDRRQLLEALQRMRHGDFSVRLPGSLTKMDGKIADTFNEIVAANEKIAAELKRVRQVVSKEGKTRERAKFDQSRGAWGEMETSVNTLIDDLLRPTTEVTGAIAAVARGQLTQTMRLDVDGRPLEGEFLRSATIVNTMIQQLSVFTSEVTRVAREVGSDGKLGGQAQVPGVSGVWKDLTESVNSMASNLTAQADRRKDEFVALLAHELRNPLAPMRNAVNILRLKESQDPDVLWCRGVIERQVTQLTRLVDDLLDVSRITLGKIKLRLQPLDLTSVVSRAVETSRPLIDSHRHELIVTLPEGPVRVEGDRARLIQVIANLLNNAAKYQNEGGTIALTVEREASSAVITVRDRGIGIAPEMLSEIFELFSQGERTLDRAQGGLGVGLSLVKTVVSLHGGSVTAASDGIGRGSEFSMRLPCLLQELDGYRPSDDGESAEVPECAPLRILVVDDSRDSADSLSRLLQLAGHEVLTAHEAEQALHLAATAQPTVILLDIGLPGMDGYEVCRRLRQSGLTNALIVAMTGYGLERDRRRSQEAGFDTHMVKPVPPGELLKLMASHAGARRSGLLSAS